MTKDFYIM